MRLLIWYRCALASGLFDLKTVLTGREGDLIRRIVDFGVAVG